MSAKEIAELINLMYPYQGEALLPSDIQKIVDARKKLTAEEWNSAPLIKDKEKYYQIVSQGIEVALAQKDKDTVHALLRLLPPADFKEHEGEKSIGSLIENHIYPRRTTIDSIDKALILLSSDLGEKYPFLESFDAWHEVLKDAVRLVNNEKAIEILVADHKQILKNYYPDLLSFAWGNHAQLMPLFRWLLNHGVKLDQGIIENLPKIAKNPNYHFPTPTPEESGYKDFYYWWETMNRNHHLAHRMDIRGTSIVNGVEFEMDGSSQAMMVPEAAHSFAQFLESQAAPDSSLAVPALATVEEQRFHNLLLQIKQDLSQVMLQPNEQVIHERLQNNELLLIPPSVIAKDGENHAIAVALLGSLCLIADRAREKDSGIEVYRKQSDNESDISSTITELASTVQGGFFVPKKANEISGYLSQKLNLEKITLIPRAEQYGENCAWSSSAKMLVFSALYLRFYQLAKELKVDDAQARAVALEQADKIYKSWSHHDKYHYLKKYLDDYKDIDRQKFGPDPILLCMIYLRNENKPKNQDIVTLLKDCGYITAENLAIAKERVYGIAEETLKVGLGKEYAQHNPELFKEMARKLADIFLVSDKKTVSQVFREMEEKIKSGHSQEIPAILERSLAQLTKKRKPEKFTPYAQALTLPAGGSATKPNAVGKQKKLR
ncbi:MAG: hypothetical protein ACHQJ6_05410 [Candidatus Berkiellales bacterium]